ncbi:hypothetical protein [Sorangium sp. So ce1024]|uniref:hypothetical protein n=1 Tax=Sorangium sp. So ce1024 TaxID=3133327 RepID=UPI003F0ED811
MSKEIDQKADEIRKKFLNLASNLIDRINNAGTSMQPPGVEQIVRAAAVALAAATGREIDPPPDGGRVIGRAARAPIDPPPDGG